MEDIALLLQGAITRAGKVLLKLNVADDRARRGHRRAAVDDLADHHRAGDRRLARASRPSCRSTGVNTLIPALKAAGARDILELPISKIVE